MNSFEKIPGKPRFDQPKTPEKIKTPAETANELRTRIVALNEKLQGTRGLEVRLQKRCDTERHQEACRAAKKIREMEIPKLEEVRNQAAAELEGVEKIRRAA